MMFLLCCVFGAMKTACGGRLQALRGPLLVKLIFLFIAGILLFTLESGVALLTDTSHAPVAAAFFATPLASLEHAADISAAALDALSADRPLGLAAADAPPPPPPPPPPQPLPVPPQPPQPATLLSAGRPVQASARGNLGPPDVVTSEAVADWLADRWQAAANMQGDPLPGEHWLEVDLGAPCSLSHVLIDYEKAYADSYTVQGRLTQDETWSEVAVGSAAAQTSASDMHVIHELPARAGAAGRYVRLLIHQPATRWGTSVWRFQVHGTRAA
jgi:hypothetical protein